MSDFADLVNYEYGRVMFISFSTAGCICEEQVYEIWNGLNCNFLFLRDIHQDGNYNTSFPHLPLFARITEEQIEEEGANEELEAQMSNNGYNDNILLQTNIAKATIMNHLIYNS
ncbi:MAG: hypothetical protein EZS28_027915 [Streblomastix strix]|uniref:Uncharacterized protein n=1 Tax=Streblomastix strix TaxID=222440 RepID=A0A5J4V2D4_9EUKA|nr:MAG: hypothetical protein EZS28_027915 [Streblomastix strix]